MYVNELFAEPPKIIPVTFGNPVFNEGAYAQAMCTVTEGDEPLSIKWSFHGHNISSNLGISTTNIGSRTSILIIPSVSHRHRGNYTCKASNPAGHVAFTTKLRVNG